MWAVTLLTIFLNSEVIFGRLQKANYKRTCRSIVSLDVQPGPVRSRGEQSPLGLSLQPLSASELPDSRDSDWHFIQFQRCSCWLFSVLHY